MTVHTNPTTAPSSLEQPVQQHDGNAVHVSFVATPSAPIQRVLPHALMQWIDEGSRAETAMRRQAANIVHSATIASETSHNLAGMNLTSLPPMPAGTRDINARNNHLAALPPSLPPTLSHLDATNNRIDHVPQALRDFPYQARIDLTANFIPQDEVEDIRAQMSAPNYHGPQFIMQRQRTHDLAARREAGLPAVGVPAGSLA